MKFVSYLDIDSPRLGIIVQERLYNLHCINPFIVENMLGFLQQEVRGMDYARITFDEIQNGQYIQKAMEKKVLVAPLPNPKSFRNILNSSSDTQFPVQYFGNHQAIVGPGLIDCMQHHFGKLDFELQIAAVLGKEGRNIRAEHADHYISGFMIMSNFISRSIQDDESRFVSISAKSMDFAISTGPFLVTPDELKDYEVEKKGHIGNHYQLKAECVVNDKPVCEVNTVDLAWTFAEIIERASYGSTLYPGDIIGSGPIPGASLKDIYSSTKEKKSDQWLQPTDKITFKVDGLGSLGNAMSLNAAEIPLVEM